MSKAEDEALAHALKYGSGLAESKQGYAPLGEDPYGIYPPVAAKEPASPSKSEKSAEPAPEKES